MNSCSSAKKTTTRPASSARGLAAGTASSARYPAASAWSRQGCSKRSSRVMSGEANGRPSCAAARRQSAEAGNLSSSAAASTGGRPVAAVSSSVPPRGISTAEKAPPRAFVRSLREPLESVRERQRLTEVRGNAKERALLVHPLLVLAEQLRHAHRQSDLTGHGLGQCDLLVAPSSGRVAVEGEHADQLVEDHDRNGENGARAETHQRVASSERGIVQLRRGLDILDRQGLAALYREIRNRKAPPGIDRFQSTLLPLRRGDVAVRAQADQAAVDRKRTTGLLHGDPQQLVDVELRANACRDPGDEAFSLERLRQTGCRHEIVAVRVDGARLRVMSAGRPAALRARTAGTPTKTTRPSVSQIPPGGTSRSTARTIP